MNRIVIIGNGFDLANGLKTSYSNFINNYLLKAINHIENRSNFYEDQLITARRINNYLHNKQKKISEIIELSEFLEREDIYILGRSKHTSSYSNYEIKIKSDFFKSLIIDVNWTDIEKHYFNQLLLIKKLNRDINKNLDILNSDFTFIKNLLKMYISNIDLDSIEKIRVENRLERIMRNDTSPEYLNVLKATTKSEEKISGTLFLNFNYTTYWHELLTTLNPNSSSINIHGTPLSSNIIFGYGDETHSEYNDLENADNHKHLENIKSFYYPLNIKYIHLLQFLNLDFDVSIVGHSLGLSDRILLKTIFEHPNCRAINIYHRGNEESYFSKVIALSRHFSDKQLMRSKIVPYLESNCI